MERFAARWCDNADVANFCNKYKMYIFGDNKCRYILH